MSWVESFSIGTVIAAAELMSQKISHSCSPVKLYFSKPLGRRSVDVWRGNPSFPYIALELGNWRKQSCIFLPSDREHVLLQSLLCVCPSVRRHICCSHFSSLSSTYCHFPHAFLITLHPSLKSCCIISSCERLIVAVFSPCKETAHFFLKHASAGSHSKSLEGSFI